MRRIVSAALIVLLSACSTLKTVPGPSGDWESRRAELQQLEYWQFRARIAVRNGAEGGQGNLAWTQQGTSSDIRLSGPLGFGSWRVVWDDSQVTVFSKDGERALNYTGEAAAEAFVASQLGWSFPVSSTRYWLLGLLDTRYPGRELFDAEGQLTGLEQHGWTVTFKRFVEVDAQLLPGGLVMDHAEGQMRVAIHQWQL